MEIKELKHKLFKQRIKLVLFGKPGSDKTKLFNELVPEDSILHSENDVDTSRKSLLTFPSVCSQQVIGIDEAQYIEPVHVEELFQFAQFEKLGLVGVYQELSELLKINSFIHDYPDVFFYDCIQRKLCSRQSLKKTVFLFKL